MDQLVQKLTEKGKRLIWKEDVALLEAAEQAQAQNLGMEEYKLKTNEEMLAVVS